MDEKQRGLIIGALIGAILGAGVAHLLMATPSDPAKESKPLEAKDLLSLTTSAALFIRKLDDIRRRMG